MKILAIETSCDDTCISIIEAKEKAGTPIPDFEILSNIISSQTEIHQEYGGVVPMLAKRAHEDNLVPVLRESLKTASVLKDQKPSKIPDSKFQILKKLFYKEENLLDKFTEITQIKRPSLDLIAVTHGPGLEPALWAGVNFARALSYWWEIPLLGVDHMEGHIAANLLKSGEIVEFPAVCLAVSGGHTQLILIKDINKYKLIGQTVDDAAGEGFDKVARLLGLGFPGGPEISRLGKKGNSKAYKFARPMINSKDYNFSFSGLKTSVLYKIKNLLGVKLNEILEDEKLKELPLKTKQDIAASFEQAAVDVLVSKTIKAAKEYQVKTIMLAGGVAANEELRKQLREKIEKELPGTQYQIPSIGLSTDNAAMIAAAAYFRKDKASLSRWKTLKAEAGLKIK